jgi:hypothetical protein
MTNPLDVSDSVPQVADKAKMIKLAEAFIDMILKAPNRELSVIILGGMLAAAYDLGADETRPKN